MQDVISDRATGRYYPYRRRAQVALAEMEEESALLRGHSPPKKERSKEALSDLISSYTYSTCTTRIRSTFVHMLLPAHTESEKWVY